MVRGQGMRLRNNFQNFALCCTQCTRLHRVLLLQSDKHTEQLVVKAITTAIPGTSQDHALNCYNTAEKLGQAMITSCIKGMTFIC